MAHTLCQQAPFRRALVVDDDGGLQLLVRVILEQTKYLVDIARDGLDAARKLDGGSYDAVICDVMMPHMDGFALHHHLQRLDRREAQRMLFISGARLDDDGMRLLRKTGCRLLTKPFTADELSRAVDEVAETS